MEPIEQIYNRYPNVKLKIEDPNDPTIYLNSVESVFTQLVRFFLNPEIHQFSMNMIYEHLKDEDLLLSLETTILFFQKNTNSVQNVNQSFYNTHLLNEQIVGQKRFSEIVEGAIEGIKFRPSMLYMYWKRQSERVPRPDLIIDGTPYWKISEVYGFIEKEKIRRQSKQIKKKGK